MSDTSYEHFLSEGKIMGSRCQDCQTLYLPPRPLCPKCEGKDMKWAELEGVGKLVAFTCISIGPSFMRELGFDRNNPYCSGVVGLEDGVKMNALIDGFDNKKPEDIKIGTRVRMKHPIQHPTHGTIPVFTACGNS